MLRHPCILGDPQNKGGQNQKWVPHPCLLGGPKKGRNATSTLHYGGSLAKGTKSKVAELDKDKTLDVQSKRIPGCGRDTG